MESRSLTSIVSVLMNSIRNGDWRCVHNCKSNWVLFWLQGKTMKDKFSTEGKTMIIRKESPQGNAFGVMAAVHQLLKAVDRNDEWPEIQERMMSGDYENLCKIAKEVTFGSIEVA
jgi:hypothetical protein